MGAVVSGGITFIGFRPMANRLQKYLVTLPTASVDAYELPHVDDGAAIDIDFSDIIVDDIADSDENNE